MAIDLISKIKPKNNGTFAMVDAVDVEMPDGSRLDAHLEAQKTAMETAIGAFTTQIEELKNKDSAVDEQFAALASNDQKLAEADSDLDARTKALEKRFADMDYGDGIVINSFSHSQTGTKERGQVIKELTLNWSLDRTPKSQTLRGNTISNSLTLAASVRSHTVSGVEITADNQSSFRWTLTATDERDKSVSKTSPGFTFLNCVYYGMSEQPETIDSAFVRSLKTKTSPTNTRVRSFTAEGDGTYIWYCLPTGLGLCAFSSAGFPAAFTLVDTIEFTSALGYTENYYVYRSDERIDKTIPIGVS